MDDQNINSVNPSLNPLPDQGQANVSNPTPLPPVDPVVSTPPPTPDVSFPSEDSGPLPLTNDVPPSPDGTASPAPEEPSMIPPSKPKLSFGKGKVVATILGILLLVGGVGAGIVLVQQQQDIREKAAAPSCTGSCTCVSATSHASQSGSCVVGIGSCFCQCRDGWSPSTDATKNTCASTSTNFCSSGSTRCKNSTTVEVCSGGIWNASSCGIGKVCNNGQCATDTTCSSGDKRCKDSSTIEVCSGGAWNATSCGTGKECKNGQCVTSGGASVPGSGETPCSSGDKRCKDSKTVEVCTGGTWNASSCGTGKECKNNDCVTSAGTSTGGVCNCNSIKGESPSCASDQTCVVNGTFFEGSFVNCVTSGSINGICKGASVPKVSEPTGSPTPTAPPGGETAQCQAVKIYDTNWVQLTTTQLSALTAGDTIRLAVSGSSTSGTIDKAQFTVNGTALSETTAKKPGSNEFYSEYIIPTGVTSFTISGKIHHSTLGWF